MVDIHTHILPGLDDGSRSLEMSIEMLRLAAEAGTTDLAATPHADSQYHYEPERVEELLQQLAEAAGPLPRLYCGCDFHLAHDNIIDALAHPARYTLNHRNYLLIELSDLVIFAHTGDHYSRLEDAGMRIIVTHPERNGLLRQRPELLEQWVAEGRMMQVTAQSLTGGFGAGAERFARWMLDRGLVHFIASDAHNVKSRPPLLDKARRAIESQYGPALAQLLFVDHPRAALEGRPLDLREFPPKRPPRQSGWLARLLGK
jgi:protein-tyrosine phosphatase